MAGDIVPIELGLTDGDVVTLWAPQWREGDDEWQALLGRDEDFFVFDGVAELAAFIRNDDDHDLAEHPSWHVVKALSAAELEPDDEHVFDLVGVPELAAGTPDALTVAELDDILAMARNLGDVCDLDVVIEFFDSNPDLGKLALGHAAFTGSSGAKAWTQIGKTIVNGWDAVLDAIDEAVTTPAVDKAAVALAEAELLAADENDVEADDAAEDSDDVDPLDEDEGDDEDDEDDEDDFWTHVGIDPIKIINGPDELYTLRCYLDDVPIFLGKDGTILAFRTPRALARYLADPHDNELAEVSTYPEIATAATDGSLEISVIDDNTYLLTGLVEDLAAGREHVDAEQLDLAVELLNDAADFADDDSVENALAKTTPLGWYISYLLKPDPNRLAPAAPHDTEAAAFRELLHELEGRLRIL
ncbi:primosomal protein [Hoyosella sp. G463]|uniref:Primosomal protein n=1 Tax=Lolliginicoccus lacisalsi TaxID=2742202 RepID=A0A927PM78_9ACTN|nr:primosomal protein [Lolliginicoccus lacisalsi]MBD8506539.1 primosomal protein [Lolliginicoccus lacisalsi]